MQSDLAVHGAQYVFTVKALTIAVLCYVAFTDFRNFRIRNESVLLLLVLYVIYALLARSPYEIAWNVVVGVIMFAILLALYAQGLMGGGDVKLLSVAALWVGVHCALVFAILLLVLIVLHLAAVGLGWLRTKAMGGRQAIAYAPSIAGALIGTMLLGCI